MNVRRELIRVARLLRMEEEEVGGSEKTTVKELPKGEYFCLKPQNGAGVSGSKVWVKGDYDRSSGKFEIFRFNDINDSRLVKGSTLAFLDFVF